MHVYVISVVIYTTVLSQMSKSSSILPQHCGNSKKKVEEDELRAVEAEPSPIDDSDANVDCVQPSEEEASEVSDHDPEDHDLQSLLSNKSIPNKKMGQLPRKKINRPRKKWAIKCFPGGLSHFLACESCNIHTE